MSGWLQKQRKGDLAALADEAGLIRDEGWLKDELVQALDEHLRKHATALSHNSAFSGYYQRNSSPVKRETRTITSVAVETDARPVRRVRRQTRVKDEFDSLDESEPSPEATYKDIAKRTSRTVQDVAGRTAYTAQDIAGRTSNTIQDIAGRTPGTAREVAKRASNTVQDVAERTPRTVQSLAERVPLPPSPAVVANTIERQTAAVKRRVSAIYEESGFVENVDYLRELGSSVHGIIAATLLLETFGLQRQLIPWIFVREIPATSITPSIAVRVPDLFALLEPTFWSASLLWTSTSLLLPLFFSYFVNLTKKPSARARSRTEEQYDSLIFNIAKALITYMVYGKGVDFFGLVNPSTVATVNSAFFGGYNGSIIGGAIGGIASIYDAILTK